MTCLLISFLLFDSNPWVDGAQIATAIVTTVGIILSFSFARKTLSEIQKDRLLSQRPFLLFNYGSNYVRVHADGSDGKKQYIRPLPDLIDGVITWTTFGQLKNIGNGPAIGIKITWLVETVTANGQDTVFDRTQKIEGLYSESWCTESVKNSHLSVEEEVGVHILPNFIRKDFEFAIEAVSGVLSITYGDTFGNKYKTRQRFTIHTNYQEEYKKGVEFIYGDFIKLDMNYA